LREVKMELIWSNREKEKKNQKGMLFWIQGQGN
jgi:hypothetical protein